MKKELFAEAILLLQQLISIESFSKSEDKTADCIKIFLKSKNIKTQRLQNNIWAINKYFDKSKPTILLNSHHDTVRPNKQYTRNPFDASIENGMLFGLGSNDAGGALVSLMACFIHFYDQENLNFNLIYAATAEEEISGEDGVAIVLPLIKPIHFGIVGEPTQMHIATAEKGLFVIDCYAHGKSGHAARDEGENAIYKALQDIEWFRSYTFKEKSTMLGEVKMTVTVINAGMQHNVVPEVCKFTVDIRSTDKYNNQQILDIIKENVSCEVVPRSTRLNPSFVPIDFAPVKIGVALGRNTYASPTTSDQALMDFDTLKMGPGDSARSHTANEYILISEIEEGITIYIDLLENYNKSLL